MAASSTATHTASDRRSRPPGQECVDEARPADEEDPGAQDDTADSQRAPDAGQEGGPATGWRARRLPAMVDGRLSLAFPKRLAHFPNAWRSAGSRPSSAQPARSPSA